MKLRELQSRLLEGIYAGGADGLPLTEGSRFDVYVSNLYWGLAVALADSYPFVQALLGEENFRFFVRRHAARFPLSGSVDDYGAELAVTFGASDELTALPFLPDVARLEWACTRAARATPLEPASTDDVAEAMSADPDQVTARLQPSLQLLRPNHAVFEPWRAFVDGGTDALEAIEPGVEALVVTHREGEAWVSQVDDAVAALIERCDGRSLAEAAAAPALADGRFANALQVIYQRGWIVGFDPVRPAPTAK